jgi:hypothetical protein
VAEDIMSLLDEYAARLARGERPDAHEYLERAGEQREELAAVLDRFLALAPAPHPDEETVALVGAWVANQPPVLELRVRRGLTRGAVVDALIGALALAATKRDKVTRYYHQLETGLLEPTRVDRSVWEALASALRVRVDDLIGWRRQPADLQAAYLRASADAALSTMAPAAPAERGTQEEPDEIDRLFLGPEAFI